MTESEWLAATDPTRMLEFLRGKASDRKLRLFAVVATRFYLADQFPDEYGPRIAAAESIADGLSPPNPKSPYWIDSRTAHEVATLTIFEQAFFGVGSDGRKARWMRDIFGPLPFRPIAFSPDWRTSTALALAEGIYADRAFDRLPILADALQDAGCDSDDILNHLRSGGEHCRGCWALDSVLGKE